uniref:cAMP-dependent protein kinase type II regulatory subunit n=1 Tax=Macrostomum lignano TaxID=282301 RepID=A0A1I8H971_9PLAT
NLLIMSSPTGPSFEVPDGLQSLLQDFTVSVLRRRPTNLVHFAAAYFRRLDLVNSAVEGDAAAVLTVPAREDSGAETDDDLDIAAAAAAAAAEAGKVPPWRANRRPSVAAPSFDPEKSEATYQRKIVPKSDEQRRRLTETVKHILLFRSLDRVSLSHVIDAMQELSVKAGDMIIEQDQEGDNFYVIERGIFEAYVTDSVSGERRLGVTYNHSGSFGELALMYYCPRAATVIAKTDGVLWSLDLDTFQQKVLMSAFKNRKKYEAFLAAVSLLSELTHYERQNVADALKEREYDDGEPILFQGDPGNEMFFVEEGSVKVMRRHSDNGLETQVNHLEKGAYFGELSLITKQPRAASCYSVGRTRVCVLHVSDFERLLGPCLEVMRRNIDSYRSQLREIFGDATSAAAAPLRVEASV